MSPGQMQIDQAVGVAGRWAVEDPVAAAAWVATFPGGKARAAAMRQVVTQWGHSDPTSAAKWLENLPEQDRNVSEQLRANIQGR